MPPFEGKMQKAEHIFEPNAIALSRRDIILICILVNIAILAILFATSHQLNKNSSTQALQSPLYTVDELKPDNLIKKEEIQPKVQVAQKPVDEIDAILHEYAKRSEEISLCSPVPKQDEYLVIQVKEGDVISKLAKQYGVKQEEIVKLNSLSSTRLKVGQTLKVPKNSQPLVTTQNSAQVETGQYYIIKSGDNPWTIARRFNLDFETLCQLNNLDEDKAKNLKIGQKIRIK